MMKKNTCLVFVFALILGCATGTTTKDVEINTSSRWSQDESIIRVTTTTPIIADWVSEIAGDNLLIESIIPYGVNPHSYQPGAREIAKITESDLIFSIGSAYEEAKITKLIANNSEIKVVEIGNVISSTEFSERTDKHGHHHGINDPHFWFDPITVMDAVELITTELSRLDPNESDYYNKRSKKYIAELEALDKYIKDAINQIPKNNREFMTPHESLGYLSKRYDIDVIHSVIPNVSSEAGVKPEDLVNAVKLIKKHDIKIIFLENETPDKSAKTVADETGIKVVSGLRVETLKDKNQNYVTFLKSNIDIIIENLKNQ
tara:strand:- start:1440 stop:2393 length:954 start_codon:yes stop_codon:yes gene_type:complete